MLKGKHVLLGVTGGIASYKIATLTSLLVKAGADVIEIGIPFSDPVAEGVVIQ